MAAPLTEPQKDLAEQWYALARKIARRYIARIGGRLGHKVTFQQACEWADDQVALALIDSARAYDSNKASFGTLLERAATRRLYDQRFRPRPFQEREGEMEEIAAPGEAPLLGMIDEEFWARVRDSLPPRTWLVIALVYRYGVSLAETGRLLGMRKPRVCQVRRQGLTILAEVLR